MKDRGDEENRKDNWDKAEIVGKVLLPVLVAIVAYFWNHERTRQETSSAMTSIAVGILSVPVGDSSSNALRSWAISVLQSPNSPPPLTDEAARVLELEALTLSYRELFDVQWEQVLPREMSTEEFLGALQLHMPPEAEVPDEE